METRVNVSSLIHALTLSLRDRRIHFNTGAGGSAIVGSLYHMNIKDDLASRVPPKWPRIGVLKLRQIGENYSVELCFDGDPPLEPWCDYTKLTVFGIFQSAGLDQETYLELLTYSITQMAYKHAVAHNPNVTANVNMPKFREPSLSLTNRCAFLDACLTGTGDDPEIVEIEDNTAYGIKVTNSYGELKFKLAKDSEEHIDEKNDVKFGNYKRPIE